MPANVAVNGLTLTHRGSNGMSSATLPDVCLTPGPPGNPLPVPYPNIAINIDLAKGTTTVSADGGNMIAIKGSQLMRSTGDEPGVSGGVTSGVFMLETNWLSYSMDVFMQGGNACRLSDKQTHNRNNTVNLNGQFEALTPRAAGDPRIRFLCELLCICLSSPEYSAGKNMYQACVENMLAANAAGKTTPGYQGQQYPDITPEQGYDAPKPGQPPQPRSGGGKGYRAPDSIVKKDPSKPPTQDNIDFLVEMKFERFGYCDNYSEQQKRRDKEIVGKGNEEKITVLTPRNCDCPSPPGENMNRDNEGRYAECQDGEQGAAQENSQPGVEFYTALTTLAAMALAGVAGLLRLAPKPVPVPVRPPVPAPVPAPAPAPPVQPPVPAPPPALPKAAQNDTTPMTDPAGVPGLAPAPNQAV